jgi:hypothetical protein
MPEGYFGGGDWTDQPTWQGMVSAAVTLAVAIVIGTLWERWRARRR